MKCLFLSAKRYSFNYSVIKGFNDNGWDVMELDYLDMFSKFKNRIVNKLGFLPNKIKSIWETDYIKKINLNYIKCYNEYKPEIVFIYNNQNIYPETLRLFKKKSRIVFLLGDNPLYSHTNSFNLYILFMADYIIAPDTFWIRQLKAMGIRNIFFDCFSSDPNIYYPFQVSQEQLKKYQSDLVYIGGAPKGSFGYKRFLFLNQFKNLNLLSFMNGKGYNNQWIKFFPDLKDKIITHQEYNPSFNNLVYNCSKVAPIELVPALFNGVHTRVFDALGSGVFPLCEYSDDLAQIFEGLNIPFIKSYQEAEEIARALINDEKTRKHLTDQMKNRVETNFRPLLTVKRVLNQLFK